MVANREANQIEEHIRNIEEKIISGQIDGLSQLFDPLRRQKLTDSQKSKLERLEIRRLWASGEADTALRRISAYIKKYEKMMSRQELHDAYLMQSLINVHLAHHQAAEKDIQAALKLDVMDPSSRSAALIDAGCLLRDRGDWDGALDQWSRAYEIAKKIPEMLTRAACASAELLSDLGRPGILDWTVRVKESAPKWGGWSALKTVQIIESSHKAYSGKIGEAVSELHRLVLESDQIQSLRVKVKARLTLAEVLIFIGDNSAAAEYLLESKKMIEIGGKLNISYLQSYAELLWFDAQIQPQSEINLWEALDRLEIILAVVAKYPRPPGAAPFWLKVGKLQKQLNLVDPARKSLLRSQSESLSAGSRRIEAMASQSLAELEFDCMTDEQKSRPAEINRILAHLSRAVEAALATDNLDLNWRSHYLKGRIYQIAGEQYLAGEELETAARYLTETLTGVSDPSLLKLYRSHPDRKDAIEELQPYLALATVPGSTPQPVISKVPDQIAAADISHDISRLETLLDSLMTLHASQTIQSILINLSAGILRTINSDRIYLRISNAPRNIEHGYSRTRKDAAPEQLFSIPGEWVRDAGLSSQPVRYSRPADADDTETRSVLMMPMISRKQSWGFLYTDRPIRLGEFQEDEIRLLETIIGAASVAVSNLILRMRLSDITDQFRKEIVPQFPNVIGQSEAMKEVFVLMQKVSASQIPVLITGETGTGKDLVAKTIHEISPRADKPYVYLDCSAIPSGLLESELFGIEKGVATGVEPRIGLLEYADGGTVFLDEIVDIPLNVQAKLLRVLQENEFEPVGSEKTVKVDIRLMSTTSRDIQKALGDKLIRDDFYYRISGVIIDLPPLRNRAGDILLLARTFLQKYNAEFKKNISGFAPETLDALSVYTFPGNVRELDHLIRKAVLFCVSEKITLPDLELPAVHMPKIDLKTELKRIEIRAVQEALLAADQDKEAAAKALGLSRSALQGLMKRRMDEGTR